MREWIVSSKKTEFIVERNRQKKVLQVGRKICVHNRTHFHFLSPLVSHFILSAPLSSLKKNLIAIKTRKVNHSYWEPESCEEYSVFHKPWLRSKRILHTVSVGYREWLVNIAKSRPFVASDQIQAILYHQFWENLNILRDNDVDEEDSVLFSRSYFCYIVEKWVVGSACLPPEKREQRVV